MAGMNVVAEKDGKEVTVDLGVAETVDQTPDVTEESAADVLDERELADARAHGLIKAKTPPPADPAEKAPAAKKPDEPDQKKAEAAPAAAPRPDLLAENADPVKEADRIKDWNPNEKALYHEKKKAVRRAQRAEAQMADLQRQLEEAKKAAPAKTGAPDPDDVLPGEAPPVAKKEPSDDEKRQAAEKRNREIQAVLNEQETDFKVTHADFDDVFTATQEMVAMVEEGKDEELAKLFPSALERKGIKVLVAEFDTAVRYADHPNLRRQAPEVAYELGALLRSKRTDSDGKKIAETPPAKPAKEPVMVEDEPPSSGRISGGSEGAPKRIIDMTMDEYLALPDERALYLKTSFPREFESLMRKLNI